MTLETVDERPEQEAKTAASAGEAKTFGLQCVYGARRLPVSLFPCVLRAEAGGRREILVRIHWHRSLYDFVLKKVIQIFKNRKPVGRRRIVAAIAQSPYGRRSDAAL